MTGAASSAAVPVLWHLKASHFNEKVRWALDYKRVPHRRVASMPGMHMFVALRLTHRNVTLPVLRIDGRTIRESSRIVAELEELHPEPPLYPADRAERARALELEAYFDENLGHDIRRVGFWPFMRDPELVRARNALIAERRGRRTAALMPAFDAIARRRFAINEPAFDRSLLQVRAVMRLIEHELGGRDHLVGDEFTIADLTAAAMLSPLIVPPQYPYRVVLTDEVRQIADELRALPAGQWMLRTYERHRPESAEVEAA
jgi:glutathione S-transferase